MVINRPVASFTYPSGVVRREGKERAAGGVVAFVALGCGSPGIVEVLAADIHHLGPHGFNARFQRWKL